MAYIRIDYSREFIMVSPEERKSIINSIDTTLSNTLELNMTDRKTTNFWKKKHYPTLEIPTNIYLLGNGTRDELHQKYKDTHGYISRQEFTNYLRELIKQKIATVN